MSRPTPLSGFPEWLPKDQLVEERVLQVLRRTFELHGFVPVQTRAVEPLSQLAGGTDTNKEIYLLRRLGNDGGDDDGSRQLGLHFDLTVPFARYVLENAGKLAFPLRRYQIQKVWRGERPQEGRFREFTQADVDVVGDGELPFHFEVELPLVMADALQALPVPPVRIQVNNRKVAEGFYRGLGLGDVPGVLRVVDKLDKIGPEQVARALQADVGATESQAQACLRLAEITTSDLSFVDRVRALQVREPLLDEGLDELARVIETGRELAPGLMVADLRIARGLDYYTGTVYESVLVGHESLGSICSGGRYDNLASAGNRRFPGVGLSIGVTRLLWRLFGDGSVRSSRPVPTAVLVALSDESSRPAAMRLAAQLRSRGVPAEVAPVAAKYGRQIRYADRRGIPFVWFSGDEGKPDQVKDIRSGEQVDADANHWMPPDEDMWPRLLTG